VQSLQAIEAILRQGDLQSRRAEKALVVPFPDELGRGAWLFSAEEFSLFA
jgi:hypothetical protein